MRLIDIDKIPGAFMIAAVAEAPEVNAIPVSWIIRWAAEHMEYGTLTIEKLLEDWRESQKGE